MLYDLPLRYVNELYIASKNGMFGLIDKIGKLIIGFNYRYFIVEKDRFKAIIDNNTFFFDLSGNEITDDNTTM